MRARVTPRAAPPAISAAPRRDGTDPTPTTGSPYTAPINVAALGADAVTLRSAAFDAGAAAGAPPLGAVTVSSYSRWAGDGPIDCVGGGGPSGESAGEVTGIVFGAVAGVALAVTGATLGYRAMQRVQAAAREARAEARSLLPPPSHDL